MFAPGSLLAAPALAELDQACELFQQATSNRRVVRFMVSQPIHRVQVAVLTCLTAGCSRPFERCR